MKREQKEFVFLLLLDAADHNLRLSLDAPLESDTIETINGIKVAFDSQVTGTEELTLDKEENQDGAGLVLIGASNCC